MKKNVYLFQIDYMHGNSAFFPYAAGALIANAKADPAIDAAFCFHAPFFIREDIDALTRRLTEPAVAGFSNYIWNFEYNKTLAKAVKARFPDCLIVFGGHQVTPDAALLREAPYIDCLLFGEGEESFAALLSAVRDGNSLTKIPNLAFRDGSSVVTTPRVLPSRTDYPSPYLTGVFDGILKTHPEMEFIAVTETVRGCPYTCAYCDDGGKNCGLRHFPEERAFAELRWFSAHNVHGFGLADSNFGMFERDERFVDEMIRLHNEEGVLRNFQVSYAKNSNERVFRITKKLNDCGMNKGATLSFQSLNADVLTNIERKNIPVATFSALLNRYNEAGIATYTELILGLPGETYDTLEQGIDTLLNAGQHNAIYIHNCECLPLSTLGQAEYIEKHGIRTAKIPLNQPHRTLTREEIPEFSHIVVRTNTMPETDWIRMNLFSSAIQALHHEGLLLFFALYLHCARGVRYADFYRGLLAYLLSRPETVGGRVFSELRDRFSAVVREQAGLVFEDRRFGDVGWPAEEFAFLRIVYEKDRFYAELRPFLASYFDDPALFDALLTYQTKTLKLPFASPFSFTSPYDFRSFFSGIINGNEKIPLQKQSSRYTVSEIARADSWADYAKYVVWYGRKDSRNVYLEELKTSSAE